MASLPSDHLARVHFIAFLREMGVSGLDGGRAVSDFEKGVGDIPLGELGIDSLALMEIGVGLEDRYRVSLSPNQILALRSVAALLARAERGK